MERVKPSSGFFFFSLRKSPRVSILILSELFFYLSPYYFTSFNHYFSEEVGMNKGELIAAVAKEAGLTKASAEKAVNSVLENIKKNAKKGVQLIGFGSFALAKRKARTGRNPQTGQTIKIKASTAVKFRAGAEFKKSVNK